MSSGNEYDALGRILSTGGEIALAIAISEGYSQSRIDAIILRFSQGASQQQIDYVREVAREISDAAVFANTLRDYEQIDISRIPINPYLFGNDPSGRRVFTSADFEINESGKRFRLDISLADLQNKQDIYDELRREAERRIAQSPGQFGVTSESEVEVFTWHLTVLERRF